MIVGVEGNDDDEYEKGVVVVSAPPPHDMRLYYID